ncbi:MAG TPA: cytochrome P450 [Acidimicrobiia bacterium]|jgi:cytochrome P450
MATSDVYYDPYDVEIYADPYPAFRRLREEAPLYYNERYDFYALSRFDDVERGFVDHETFSSAHGGVLEAIQARFEAPRGVFIMEDPPLHTMHRGVLSRVFSPKKVAALEPQIRAFCAETLDPLVGSTTFDFVDDIGAKMPMRVIGMLLGIPDEDQEAIRQKGDRRLSREPGKPREYRSGQFTDDEFFGAYVDWRAEHPSDDLMTDLLNAEFADETGCMRKLTRDEIMTFVNVLASAGNETTRRLIGWTGKVLADHPDQRRELVADRSLVPNAIEEILRYEPPSINGGRYVARDVELYGEVVPEGSAMMLLRGAANRDHRAFPPDGDVFDIHRVFGHHLSFGYGIHFCLGAALARLEGQVALEEVLDRFPDWEVDAERAELDSSVVRGWKTLPVSVG